MPRARGVSSRLFGIGVDLCPVARMARALPRLAPRAFTPAERRAAAALPPARAAEYCAGRWAAKEALLKALGVGISGVIPMNRIEIRAGARGRPRVALAPADRARLRRLGAAAIHLSISHADGIAVAVVLIERK
jgi:holo-[acyl-carrier protein] synthase